MKKAIIKAAILLAAVCATKTMATGHGYWTPNLIVAVANGNIQVRFAENPSVWYTAYASTDAALNSGCSKIYTMLLDAYNNGRKVYFDETSGTINWTRIETGN